MALFPFHTWAAKGYEAAPTSVSMLHAGVLKKFGLYGLIQIAVPLCQKVQSLEPIFNVVGFGKYLFVGFVTMAQTNLKVWWAMVQLCIWGIVFLELQHVPHWVRCRGNVDGCSWSVGFSYVPSCHTDIIKRSGTFEMDEMGGLGQKLPFLACFFVLHHLATIGLPGLVIFGASLEFFFL